MPAGAARCVQCSSGVGRPASCQACGAITDGSPFCDRHRNHEEQTRGARQPYRGGYDQAYLRNRRLRFDLAGGLCEFCGQKIERDEFGRLIFETHHHLALSRGGTGDVSNLRVCHHECHPRGRRARRGEPG